MATKNVVNTKKKKGDKATSLQAEHMWLADMILSLVYAHLYRWDPGSGQLRTLEDSRMRILTSEDDLVECSDEESQGNIEIWQLFSQENQEDSKRLKSIQNKTCLFPYLEGHTD